ncbi:YdcF family protein [Sphingorhabdus sp.]|uniref:YdcF family protein n=1 Tax=Sphingorhabdus sp. TaxID=1902408 RepID=UPI00391D91ED
MIRRSIAFILLIWMLGFAWFALLLPQPAPITQTDAVVVLTGGPNRIDRGLEILESGKSKKMLISGVDRDVKPRELAAQYPGSATYFECCIALGFQSVDTRSNALETAAWVKRNKVRSLRLVTNDWHMRRARFELDRALPNSVAVTSDAVSTQPSLGALFKEYNKYWLRAVASLLGL